MFQPTGPHLSLPTASSVIDAVRDPTSVVFNLDGYQVLAACDLPLGGRRVSAVANSVEAACPDCGVVSTRVLAALAPARPAGRPADRAPSRPGWMCVESKDLCAGAPTSFDTTHI